MKKATYLGHILICSHLIGTSPVRMGVKTVSTCSGIYDIDTGSSVPSNYGILASANTFLQCMVLLQDSVTGDPILRGNLCRLSDVKLQVLNLILCRL